MPSRAKYRDRTGAALIILGIVLEATLDRLFARATAQPDKQDDPSPKLPR